jgi:hypothetical protein
MRLPDPEPRRLSQQTVDEQGMGRKRPFGCFGDLTKINLQIHLACAFLSTAFRPSCHNGPFQF